MSTQAQIIADLAQKYPDVPIKALHEAYRAGFEQGVNIVGQHKDKVLETIMRVVAP